MTELASDKAHQKPLVTAATDSTADALLDLSQVSFRFITPRDALPTQYLHFSITAPKVTSTPSAKDTNTSATLSESQLLLMFSRYGRILGLTLPPPHRSGYVMYEFKHQAAHALNALHNQPTHTYGITLHIHFAAVRTASTATSTPSPLTESSASAQLSSLRLYPEFLPASSLSALDSDYTTHHLHRGHLTFGAALEEEDDKFGLPAPKPLTQTLTDLIHQIQTRTTSATSHITNSTTSTASSPALYNPSSAALAATDSLTSAFNRIETLVLHPGAGVKPTLHDTHRYHGHLALLPLDAHLLIDLYHEQQADKPLISIMLQPNSLLYVPASVSSRFLYGVAYRTRDVIDGTKIKRSKCVLNIITAVKDPHQHAPKDDERKESASDTIAPAPQFPRLRPSQRQKQQKRPTAEQQDRVHVSNALPASLSTLSPALLEYHHVHQVYDSIATHFSSTRHSPWPRVEAYLRALPAGSFIADIGCGNGKYMSVNPTLRMIGCDISSQLIAICKQRGYEVLVADCLALPFSSNHFDGAISIALLHHLSTVERRLTALKEMLRVVKDGGRVLLTAWAQEQDATSKRRFEQQDVLVPWRVPKTFQTVKEGNSSNSDHADDSASTMIPSSDAGAEKEQELYRTGSDDKSKQSKSGDEVIMQRYCHVYVEGEIEGLLGQIGGNRVIDQYYDRGNWVVLFEKTNS